MVSYLTTEDVEKMHRVLIEKYGGILGIRDPGLLESAIFRPQSGYYDGVVLQAAALFESLLLNHPFIDGNKRIAFAATDVFLRQNGYRLNTESNKAHTKIIELFSSGQMNIDNIYSWLNGITQRK